MFDAAVRDWYLSQLATIASSDAEAAKQGVPLEERALRAWKIRHDARVVARDRMSDRIAVAIIRTRDLLVYGQADGPTFEQLVASARGRGLTADEAYPDLIQRSQTSNEFINRAVLRKKSKGPNKKKRGPAH